MPAPVTLTVTGTNQAQVTIAGAQGPPGVAGLGVPTGGAVGDLLTKSGTGDGVTAWQAPGAVSTVTWGNVTGKPSSITSLSGVNTGDQDLSAYTTTAAVAAGYSPLGHTHSFTALTGKPTTLAGYGITDAEAASHAAATYAPIDSPALTGIPLAPTPGTADDSTKIATTAMVQAVIRALVGLAPADLDTLKEIADRLQGDETTAAALASTVATKLAKASNLSDLTSVSTARANLGVPTGSGTSTGTNTGDQTITLTGDVTGSGTGSFATSIGAGKVTNTMLAGAIDLTAKVTGVLPSANGGTGVNNGGRTLTVSTNSGVIAFAGALTLTVSDNANVAGTNTGDQDLSPYALISSLATVATSGAYSDLTGSPDLSVYQSRDGDLDSLSNVTDTDVIYYRSAPDTWTPVTVGSGLSFTSGTLTATGGGGGGITSIQNATTPTDCAGMVYGDGAVIQSDSAVTTDGMGNLAVVGITTTGGATLGGTVTVPTAAVHDNSTAAASTAFVVNEIALAVAGLLDMQGDLDCSGNPDYPMAVKGAAYYVTVAGIVGGLAGKPVDIADVIVCKADNAGGDEAAVGTSWFVLEHNLQGALLAANNLSDLGSTLMARASLGLGSLAVQNGAFTGGGTIATGGFTLTITADAAIGGTNTGDQTITLTGDVTGSGTGSFAATIANGAVTLAKQANMATASVVYRKTAGSGAPEVQTLATLKTDLGLTGTNSGDQTITLTGHVTGSGTGSFATTIAAGVVTNAMLAGAIDLTTKVTGVLPAANGGTGVNNSTRTLTIAANSGTISFTSAVTLTVAAAASVSGTNTGDQTTVSGNAGTATALQTARTINGTSFDGTADIIIGIPQNSKSVAYTTVLSDNGKHIFHPAADTTARIWTIDSNANVAYPIGAAITFVNQHGAGVITIKITTDTMRLAGAGTTGDRTLAADGIATALKVTSTEWIISGTGLT